MPPVETKFLTEPRTVVGLGAPLKYGQPVEGVEFGPAAIRAAGLRSVCTSLGWRYKELGDLELPYVAGLADEYPRFAATVGRGNQLIADVVAHHASEEALVLTLGGDHGVGVGTVAGQLVARPEVGVLWIDAHADINTPESSPSGYLHGMVLSLLTGLANPALIPGFEWMAGIPQLPGSQLAYIGLRDVDPGERRFIKQLGAAAFTMHDVDKLGIGKVTEMALDHLGSTRPLHVSYDVDACDPVVAPSTGTAVRGGLTYREAHYVAEEASQTGRLVGLDLVEVNPGLVVGDVSVGDATAQLAVALIGSALGSTIL